MTSQSSASPSSSSPASSAPLNDLGRFIYGTTRLGDAAIGFGDRVRLARAAMDHGVWFHTSHQYGDALSVLRAAVDEDAALRAGHASGLIDGYIFYFNPLQRFATNPLWDLLLATRSPIIAMRTLAGGNVHDLRDVPGAAWKDYLRVRAGEVAPIFERSKVASWPEFCLRFVHGLPIVRASVGATARADRLAQLVELARGPLPPLAPDVSADLEKLQRRWSDELDVHGTPGSM